MIQFVPNLKIATSNIHFVGDLLSEFKERDGRGKCDSISGVRSDRDDELEVEIWI